MCTQCSLSRSRDCTLGTNKHLISSLQTREQAFSMTLYVNFFMFHQGLNDIHH